MTLLLTVVIVLAVLELTAVLAMIPMLTLKSYGVPVWAGIRAHRALRRTIRKKRLKRDYIMHSPADRMVFMLCPGSYRKILFAVDVANDGFPLAIGDECDAICFASVPLWPLVWVNKTRARFENEEGRTVLNRFPFSSPHAVAMPGDVWEIAHRLSRSKLSVPVHWK